MPEIQRPRRYSHKLALIPPLQQVEKNQEEKSGGGSGCDEVRPRPVDGKSKLGREAVALIFSAAAWGRVSCLDIERSETQSVMSLDAASSATGAVT
jgi:hypothetical protein